MTAVSNIKKRLHAEASPEKATAWRSFYKTEKGEYGEGDIFIGVSVPVIRKIIRESKNITLKDITTLQRSKIHEERFAGTVALVERFKNSNDNDREKVVRHYLSHTRFINNWDIVDASASQILGTWLLSRPRKILHKLAQSPILWERRIAIVATHAFIKHHDTHDTFVIAKILLHDREDLIQKATGWMLREAGKQSLTELETFLKHHSSDMPRTMLRYAIERFPERKRQRYLKGTL